MYIEPLPARSDKKKKCGAVETHRTVRLTMSAYSGDAGTAWTSRERESAIRLPTVVRFCHRDFAVEGFFDSVRVLLDRLVAVEEIVEQ